MAPTAYQRPKISTPDPHIIVVGTRSNLRHIVVKNGLLHAIIPLDGYARPVLFDDGALIDLIVLPANAVPTVSNRDWSPVMHQSSLDLRATVSDLDLTVRVPRM
jgi:hypothetical protein